MVKFVFSAGEQISLLQNENVIVYRIVTQPCLIIINICLLQSA